jgi:hypothetical protein
VHRGQLRAEHPAPRQQHCGQAGQHRVDLAQAVHRSGGIASAKPHQRAPHGVGPDLEALEAGRSGRVSGDMIGAQNGEDRCDQFGAVVLGVGDGVIGELPEFGPLDLRVEPAHDRAANEVALKYIPAAEIARVRFDSSMVDAVVPKFSEMMRAAVERNLYRTDNMEPGEMRPVLETDPNTGRQIRSWIGPTSFVKEMGQPCRRVVRINTPASTPLYATDRRSTGQIFG